MVQSRSRCYFDAALVRRLMTPRPGWAREAEARIAGQQDSGGALTAWVEVIENRGHDGGGMTAGQAQGVGGGARPGGRRPGTG